MGFAHNLSHIAVTPLQALVDFFAPHRPSAIKNVAERADIYWARAQFNRNQSATGLAREPVPRATSPAQASAAAHRARVSDRPWANTARPGVTRVARTGLALAPVVNIVPSYMSSPSLPGVRLRRAPEAVGATEAGRMVISGRMRDVCAALDQLAV